jgi:carbonic anhydrase
MNQPKRFAGAALITGFLLMSAAAWAAAPTHATPALTPSQALDQLMKGNARFVAHGAQHPHETAARMTEVAAGQHPLAVVLSCSDSRVPPELVFDQGLGDVFTVRVAGNVLDDAVVGSIEYAVEHTGTPLVIVLGHEKCGAVTAAVNGAEGGNHIHAVTDPIMPVVAEAKKDTRDPVDAAIRLNVKKVVGELENSTPILAARAKDGSIQIVGAYYSLDTGKVTLLTGPHASAPTAEK